jgi:amino acid transporter
MSAQPTPPVPPTASPPVQVVKPVEQPDVSVLEKYGYKQQLHRTLRLFSLFAIAFSIISISTGIFLNYGFGITQYGPSFIWTWAIAVGGQFLVALVIAELCTKIPIAGYAYQWGARLVNSSYGWFVGFFALLYMSITGGAIILLGSTPLLLNVLGQSSPNPRLVLTVALILMVVAIAVNIISVQVTARVNNVAVFAEIFGTVLFAVILLVLYAIHPGTKTGLPAGHLLRDIGSVGGAAWYRFFLAGLIGIYTLVGFELSADLTEEAVKSQRDVPRGILIAVASAGALGMLALIGFTLGIHNLHAVQSSSLPIVTIGDYWMPSWLVKVLIFLVAFAMFALVVVNQAAQARLLFSLGRDNMLPFSRFFRAVNTRTRTPILALIIGGVVSVAFMVYGYAQTNSFTTLVGSTSTAPYIVYLFIVVSYMWRRSELAAVKGGFNLGRAGKPIMIVALIWVIGALLVLILPAPFHGADRVVGGAAVVALLWYFIVLRGRLRRKEAGVALFGETSASVSGELAKAAAEEEAA